MSEVQKQKTEKHNIEKILILGAGKMGLWLAESLCLDYEVAIYDKIPEKMKYVFRTVRINNPEEITKFDPDLLINAVNLQKTTAVFDWIIPYLPEKTIISDIASVKNGLKKYYAGCTHRFVSTHPMFGPTFGNIKDLSNENAVIISESCEEGKAFFRSFYESLHLRIFEYSFDQHDQTIAYSLSVPFASTMVFAACMVKMEVPGTTFKKHLNIATGLLSEDKYLLSEILLNPFTLPQLERIHDSLAGLMELIRKRDSAGIHEFLLELRDNIGLK
ncbi:MAG TPA: prephenate dehydrogenase [Bacteroidetes bacterium]|nr:prephenate dehydrogenase [Bacteroidota bacterium]